MKRTQITYLDGPHNSGRTTNALIQACNSSNPVLWVTTDDNQQSLQSLFDHNESQFMNAIMDPSEFIIVPASNCVCYSHRVDHHVQELGFIDYLEEALATSPMPIDFNSLLVVFDGIHPKMADAAMNHFIEKMAVPQFIITRTFIKPAQNKA